MQQVNFHEAYDMNLKIDDTFGPFGGGYHPHGWDPCILRDDSAEFAKRPDQAQSIPVLFPAKAAIFWVAAYKDLPKSFPLSKSPLLLFGFENRVEVVFELPLSSGVGSHAFLP
ncbi:hypothetical protein OIU74_001028 [Salix koriyanagi]|uniref:Uncharacterized protein n=1 Tax=Salix koriyanagi TaxID=2511006 RepID=A0A9Q1AMN2_9ROSI|nr:hypothetical protein OIU74_001028 [Salix koriyanagi]